MSRVGAFFLGMLFGIIALLGGIAGGAYIAVTVITPAKVNSQAQNYIGDLADLSLLDIAKNMKALYLQELGITDEQGNYFSVGDFCEKYNIDLNTALQMDVPQELLDMPMFEFFNQSTNEQGENGMKRALKQVKVSAIPAVLNMFPKEEGSDKISQDVLNELSNYSVADLTDQSKGVAYVFQNISVADLLPSNFPAEDSENKLMWAVGQASIGKLYGAMGASQNLFLQVKEGGALEDLGQLKATDILGNNEMLQNILSDMKVADIVDENGSISLDSVIESMYLGGLLGNSRKEIAEIEGFEPLVDDTVFQQIGADNFAKLDNGKYYEASLTCSEKVAEGGHSHTADCYGFVWYTDKECTTPVEGINQVLVNIPVKQLMAGASDTLLEKFKDVKLGDVMGEGATGFVANLADMTIGELMDGGLENIYLGSVLGYARDKVEDIAGYTAVIENVMQSADSFIKKDGENWYVAKLICENAEDAHVHTVDCYGFVWKDNAEIVSGVMGKLADKQINQLNNINDIVMTLTIGEVLEGQSLTGVLGALKDVPINKISTEIDNIYIGTVLDYKRSAVENTESYTDTVTNVKSDGENYIRLEKDVWYKAELTCTENHTHTDTCFEFIWYTDEACTDAVYGIQKAFVNAKINTVGDVMDNLTLRKLGIGGNNLLDSLQDVPLNDLGTEINNLKLGVIFGFVQNGNIWYEKCAENCEHGAADHTTLEGYDGFYSEAKGLNGKVANKSVSEISTGNGLTEIALELTIGDLIDSKMMKLGDTVDQIEENEAKFNILFCTDTNAVFTETIYVSGVPAGTKDYHCNLADYLLYNTTASTRLSAKEYYNKFTHAAGCAENWKLMKLTDFITALLDAIDVGSAA